MWLLDSRAAEALSPSAVQQWDSRRRHSPHPSHCRLRRRRLSTWRLAPHLQLPATMNLTLLSCHAGKYSSTFHFLC